MIPIPLSSRGEEGGFAILAVALVMMLALMIPLGATVLLEHSNLVASAKRAQTLISLRGHESLTIRVDRNADNTVIAAYNTGSTQSIIQSLLIKNTDNSLTIDENLGLKDSPAIYVDILDNRVFTENRPIDENRVIGVLTQLGNAFWEE